MTSEGVPRFELFDEGVLVDSVNVQRFSNEEVNELLVEMGQKRDETLTWEGLKSASKFDKMVNNWDQYKEFESNAEYQKGGQK